jgi:sarcosine oxidase, subunit gamma
MLEPFTSPLAHRAEPQGLSISMREIHLGMIDLRGRISDTQFMNAARQVLGTDLPLTPRTATRSGETKALWLSIDQWLITAPRDKVDALYADLNAALAHVHALPVNVSDMRAIIRLEGEGVRETLMKGTSLDLTRDYPPGTVRRMRFAEIAALLHIVESHVIDVYVFRSYADYAWDFLLKAARKGSEVRLWNDDEQFA